MGNPGWNFFIFKKKKKKEWEFKDLQKKKKEFPSFYAKIPVKNGKFLFFFFFFLIWNQSEILGVPMSSLPSWPEKCLIGGGGIPYEKWEYFFFFF